MNSLRISRQAIFNLKIIHSTVHLAGLNDLLDREPKLFFPENMNTKTALVLLLVFGLVMQSEGSRFYIRRRRYDSLKHRRRGENYKRFEG